MRKIVVQIPEGERLERFLVALHEILPVGGTILDRTQAEPDDEEEEEEVPKKEEPEERPRRKR